MTFMSAAFDLGLTNGDYAFISIDFGNMVKRIPDWPGDPAIFNGEHSVCVCVIVVGVGVDAANVVVVVDDDDDDDRTSGHHHRRCSRTRSIRHLHARHLQCY